MELKSKKALYKNLSIVRKVSKIYLEIIGKYGKIEKNRVGGIV